MGRFAIPAAWSPRVSLPGSPDADPDFMFLVTAEKWANLRSQIVTSSWGGHRGRPYAFTEPGVAMLSSVLRSPRAVAVIVEIMRAFVRLRRLMIEHADLAARLDFGST